MRIVCVDDEELALKYLQRQLEKIKTIDVQATFTNPYEGMDYILKEEVDVALLDVQMPKINGIELAERLLEEKPNLIVVFITAFETYAVDAFQLNALDYLVKPISFKRLQNAVKRMEKKLQETSQSTIFGKKLKVSLAPSLAFETKPNVFTPIQWRTAKTQELFIYLLQNKGLFVEKSSIIDLLWVEYELDKAYPLLYTTIYNIRKALKPFSEQIILQNRTDGYLLELKNVEIDLIKWQEELSRLTEVDDITIEVYEDAMQLNKGHYWSSVKKVDNV